MIKPIFSPNAKNNMAEIVPILLASKCRALYVVKDEAGFISQAIVEAQIALQYDQARGTSYGMAHRSVDLPSGSSLLVCRMDNATSYLQEEQYAAIYVQAHKYESPDLSHEEFVQLATDHLAESRKSLQERLVATGALEPGAVLPTALIKNAE